MNIYERLIKDHDEQRKLAKNIMETSGDSEERRQLWDKLKPEAVAHANAEEQTLYAALIENPDTQEQSRHSVSEHKKADDLIAELSKMAMSSGSWIQIFEKLKIELEHHMDEEENKVFIEAKEVIDPATARNLCDEFEERKRAELDG